MDILRPSLVYINGRCYRKNALKVIQDESSYVEEDDEDFENSTTTYFDEVCDININIEKTGSGYRLCKEVPSAFFRFIIGKKGETKKRIENETQTQIRIPRVGEEGDIVINGRDRKGVLSAKTRIEVLVESARQKTPFTHFLSFPITGDLIKERFEEFKHDVLYSCTGDRGIDDTIFQNPLKLHLTVGTMVLMNDKEISDARDVLLQFRDDLVDPILKRSPLLAEFKGLEYMNDDPDDVDVLYAKVKLKDGSDRLQILADRLVDKFVFAGLLQQDYNRVKLHVTVMNTLFRKDPTGASVPKSQTRRGPVKNRESFSASNILRLHGDYDFGSHRIGELHISTRHSVDKNGYYMPVAYIDLP